MTLGKPSLPFPLVYLLSVLLEKYKMTEPQFISRNLAIKEFELKDTHDEKLVIFQNDCIKFTSIIAIGKSKIVFDQISSAHNRAVI